MSEDNDIKKLLTKAADQIGFDLKSFSRLTGGDINEVFLLTSKNSEQLVIKINNARKFPGMFEAEFKGLQALASPNCIDVPNPKFTGEIEDHAFLILEFKASAQPSENFWHLFGKQLANLHSTTSESFGFEGDNYIANLHQYNSYTKSASEFYITQRLEPQLKLAVDNGYLSKTPESFLNNISELIPQEAPALTHGDLWSGNYLVNSEGKPCLIDPAVSFASREMDLALMKMFGGFNSELFESYHAQFPILAGFEERLPIWKLYYLLVHLNIFGLGYKRQVQQIIKQFN